MEAAEAESGNVSGMVLGLLAVIWFFGVPLCLWQAIAAALTGYAGFEGEGTNAWLTAAAVIFTVVPVLATGICVVTRRVVRAWIFGLVAAACVLLVLAGLYSEARRAELLRPPEPLPSGYCAEYSGGDSDCPGG
ncbi:hypothetical protein Nocox_03820 [Nonomuraea coxensis DSM 45129]|uniref:Uncharacterized protein n=1 Tax=Nonomuraea coxensis DSM 45129 TaxID=1122611 RepID=A0ABX8TSE5_9ACTN|nr:hypothetical protein [Nonomuraea coxensis]QYC38392.1 hypothetical protein Nocox_03820 [Nonomuraea coxensis DSM 45129]